MNVTEVSNSIWRFYALENLQWLDKYKFKTILSVCLCLKMSLLSLVLGTMLSVPGCQNWRTTTQIRTCYQGGTCLLAQRWTSTGPQEWSMIHIKPFSLWKLCVQSTFALFVTAPLLWIPTITDKATEKLKMTLTITELPTLLWYQHNNLSITQTSWTSHTISMYLCITVVVVRHVSTCINTLLECFIFTSFSWYRTMLAPFPSRLWLVNSTFILTPAIADSLYYRLQTSDCTCTLYIPRVSTITRVDCKQ